MVGKGAYLKKITSKFQRFRSIDIGKRLEGTSPPSVFIGKYGYPKVQIGPMMTPEYGDTSLLDTPEAWIPNANTTQDIIDFRLQLVRGKETVGITDLDHKLVQKLQTISLTKSSIEAEAEFIGRPTGFSLNEEHQPFGPSAQIKKFDIGNSKWDKQLESVYYDSDFRAADAVSQLYERGILFSQIQKAFSVGTMGIDKRRRLVPTRWSITAVDDTLANYLLESVRYYEIIDGYEVYEFESLNNYYAILLIPTPWQYEWFEAFIHVLGSEEVIFSDYEGHRGKKGYSTVGGCYYSCKFGLLEALKEQERQAGAIVFREAYPNYVPLGVFNVRENVRNAMLQYPRRFENMGSALSYISTKLKLPLSRFMDESSLLKDLMKSKQTSIPGYTL